MKKLTQQETEKYYRDRGYELLSTYVNARTKNKIRSINTGKVYWQSFDAFHSGHRPDGKMVAPNKYTAEDINRLAEKRGYKIISEYQGMNNKATFKCPMGHTWKVKPSAIINQLYNCPHCSIRESKGENFVRNILEYNKIEYEQEKTIIINNNHHRFDFILTLHDKHYAVEYNGGQHYKSVDYFGGDTELKNRQIRDEEKRMYCVNNNIQLISIHYSYNTPKKIIEFLKNECHLDILPYDDQQSYTDKFYTNEIAEYYLTHSRKETIDKFSTSDSAVMDYFRRKYGISKREYIVIQSAYECSEFYLTHSRKETMKKFSVNGVTVNNYFNKTYGVSKRQYLIQHPELNN